MIIKQDTDSKAKTIALSLTNDQAVYLHIAQKLWEESDIFAEDIIADIEDTEGQYSVFNELSLDFSEQPFNDIQVEDTIDLWYQLVDHEGEYVDSNISSLDVLDHILGTDTSIESFYNVEVNVVGATGSYAYPARSDKKVKIQDILNHLDLDTIIKNFLAIDG